MLVLSMELCDSSQTTCRVVDFEKWLEGKFIAYLVNEKHYGKTEVEGDDENENTSKLRWVPISQQVRTTYQKKVEVSKL